MKKATAVLLLFLYLLSSTGVSVAAHFCGSSLSSFTLTSEAAHKCKCSKKAQKKDNCCSSKKAFLKLTTEHKVQGTGVSVKPALTFILFSSTCLQLVSCGLAGAAPFNTKAPPGSSTGDALFLRFHTLLI